jgi:hypothetical protein
MAAKRTGSKKKPPGVIFRPWRTLRDGTVIYAKDYGLKAFPIKVGANDNEPPKAR